MFNQTRKEEKSELDDLITSLISEIASLSADTEEHGRACASLKILMEARSADRVSKPAFVSPEAIAKIAANLLGIGLILGFEKANVLTTKSLPFVPKVTI